MHFAQPCARLCAGAFIGAVMLGLGLQGSGLAQDTTEEEYEFGLLHDAPGVESTYYACTACHSEMIVAQQGLTRAEWDELFDWMIDEQGMVEIESSERDEILDYLAAHYNEDRPNFPRPDGSGTN
ncbi:MAG: aldehyde dehydrogenase [Pseudomonadota bacterium]